MLPAVAERIAAACRRAGRQAAEVRLVAVSKGRSAADIARCVLNYGHSELGENRAQELRDKRLLLPADIKWHFIGNLQRNKVKYLAGVSMVHSLTSAPLADALNALAVREGRRLAVLIEVNVAGEASKLGVGPAGLGALAEHTNALANLELVGLMAMAPFSPDPELARPVFAKLRGLRDSLGLRELSMGMSGDFEVAVEEGATIVRVGTALFGSEAAL